MARQRSTAPELARLLDRVTRPIYVLDEQLRIAFMNQACRDWLGEAADDLLGRRCYYHSGPELAAADAVAAGLCPPPLVLSGQPATAAVAAPASGDASRQARFLPLGESAEELIGIVAVLDGDANKPAARPATAAIHEALQLHDDLRRFRRQAALTIGMDRLVGTSPGIRRAAAQVQLACGAAASLLVVGPAGSGSIHVAEAIHYAGKQPGALVPLDCALLGAELIHSALQALASALPPGGAPRQNTLLLAGVDLLPAEIQAELARKLAAPGFPLRLMATAEQPLVESVRRGRYREDLAALLSTITIELLPLAQRREDLPLLAQALLEQANVRGGRQLAGFSAEALDRLDAYGWPGDVDELAAAVAAAHGRAAGPEITPADLPESLHLAAQAAARPRRKEEPIVLDEFLARIERELIRRAVARAKGNKAKAARLLGLTRPRLYRRMVQLGLLTEGETG
jgi:DNA-binding NtrC family response regulator